MGHYYADMMCNTCGEVRCVCPCKGCKNVNNCVCPCKYCGKRYDKSGPFHYCKGSIEALDKAMKLFKKK